MTGVLVAIAVWCAVARGGRGLRGVVRSTAGSRLFARRGRSREDAPGPTSVRLVVAQVAALLRSGAAPGVAWAQAAGVRVDSLGVPDRAELTRVVRGGAGRGPGLRRGAGRAGPRRRPGPDDAERQAAAVIAASRLAAEVGAPLGAVLESIAQAVTAEAEGRAEREAALAGPLATARVLLWLPVVGVLLGLVLGVDPLATLLGGGIGTVGLLLGVALLWTGRRWSGRLVAAARVAGSPL